MPINPWIQAARLRTLPLAISTMIMGHSLAAYDGYFNWSIAIISIFTAVSLQVLSNFANDYGDSIHGADHAERTGPKRAVQTGLISTRQMKRAVKIFVVISFTLGLALILVAFDDWILRIGFLLLGVTAIWAAINYTAGSKPYGYSGKGDISVLIFFGLVTVIGSYFLQTKMIRWQILLPALSCGLLSVGVLNINNIRDITSDQLAGKFSIPVKIGRKAAVNYHGLLLSFAILSLITFGIVESFDMSLRWLFMVTAPLFIINFRAVKNKTEAAAIDPYLKQLALSSAFLFLCFSVLILMFP